MSLDAELKVAKHREKRSMKRRAPSIGREELATEIASLSKLDIDELRERWKAMFGNAPSRDISRSFLTRAIAYRLQEKVFGGLKPSTQRLLAEFAHDGANGPAAAPSRIVQSGAVLVREWRGISHQVSVLEKGFSFPRQALSFALGSRARDYRDSLVGPVVLRPQAIARGEPQWSTLSREHDAAQSIRAKSSEEGLEQDFNSLHAQREACEAFIKSQTGEGWRLIKTAYDDGGLSGGTMERPALQRLLEDIRRRLVDVVVVYKVDRLTRSLADFAKMVELFDAHGVSFVAVTQQFNTTTSMGRLTLNVLLSFAQFEREVTGERIRDKIAASKRKGMWMGGVPPLGYDVRDRRLVVNRAEAATVKHIYERYLELGSVRLLKGRFGARRGRLQNPGIEKRRAIGWPAIFARGSVPDAVEPDLPRRNPPQEGTPSRPTPANSEPRALGEGPATLARSCRHASRTPDQGAA